MYSECALSTYLPYKLIDHSRTQHTLNSVVKEAAYAQIDSVHEHFELLVSRSNYLYAGEHVVQPLGLVERVIGSRIGGEGG
jgi:hypothetical protein